MNNAMAVVPDNMSAQRDGARARALAALAEETSFQTEPARYSRGKEAGVAAVVIETLLFLIVAAVAFVWTNEPSDSPTRPTAMVVDLLPLPSAPPVPPEEVPPGPKQVKADETPKPPEKKKQELPIPIVRLPVPTVPAAAKPDPQPNPDPKPELKRVEQTTAPAPAPLPPKEVAGAPMLGTPTVSEKVAQQTWEDKVLARLERMKRYPAEAQSAGQQDRIFVMVTIDRTGRVLSRSIVRSRGMQLLDAEVMALIMRASPLPTPPASLRDADLTFDVPIEFAMSGTRGRRRR